MITFSGWLGKPVEKDPSEYLVPILCHFLVSVLIVFLFLILRPSVIYCILFIYIFLPF
jgi:hypothetical protein